MTLVDWICAIVYSQLKTNCKRSMCQPVCNLNSRVLPQWIFRISVPWSMELSASISSSLLTIRTYWCYCLIDCIGTLSTKRRFNSTERRKLRGNHTILSLSFLTRMVTLNFQQQDRNNFKLRHLSVLLPFINKGIKLLVWKLLTLSGSNSLWRL